MLMQYSFLDRQKEPTGGFTGEPAETTRTRDDTPNCRESPEKARSLTQTAFERRRWPVAGLLQAARKFQGPCRTVPVAGGAKIPIILMRCNSAS